MHTSDRMYTYFDDNNIKLRSFQFFPLYLDIRGELLPRFIRSYQCYLMSYAFIQNTKIPI